MPANLIAHLSAAGEFVTRPYTTVADLRKVLADLPDDAVVLTHDDESGEFQPYPYPMQRKVLVYGVFPSAGFVYFDLERPDDWNQPEPIETFEGVLI